MAKAIWIVNFRKFHPPSKAVNVEVRNGGSLKWIRLETDWYDDEDILDMPMELRWLWPAMCALAGKSTPPGRIDKTTAQLAREMRVTDEQMEVAMRHLRLRKRVRYSPPKGVA